MPQSEGISTRYVIWIWAMLALIALVLHIWLATTVCCPEAPLGADGINYEQAANQLLSSRDLLDPLFLKPKSYWPPLWPLTLTALYSVFSHNQFVVRVFESLLVVVTSFFTLLIGKDLFDEHTGLIASLFVLFSPTLFVFATLHNLEILLMTLLTVSLYCLVHSHCTPSGKWGYGYLISAGLLLGFGSLTKAVLLAFLPFILVWELIQANKSLREKVTRALIFAIAVILVILPWTLRDYLVFRELILVSSNGGINLEIGNNPWATGGFYITPDWEKLGQGNEATLVRIGSFIRDNPDRYLQILKSKFVGFWSAEYLFVSGSADNIIAGPMGRFGNQWLGPRHALFNYCSNVLLAIGLGFSMLGNRSLIRRRILIFLTIVSFVMVSLVFFGEPRYRIPIYPILAILQGFAIVFVIQSLARYAAKAIRRAFSLLKLQRADGGTVS